MERKESNRIWNYKTLLTAKGGTVTTNGTSSDAFGIVFTDVDFNDSKGTEVVPVLIHGVVDIKKIKLDSVNHAKEIEALKRAVNFGIEESEFDIFS